MDVVNRPRVSRFVAGLYVGIVVFVAALIVFFTHAGFFTPTGILGLTAVVVLIFVEAIMLLILISIYRTKYILTNKELVIKTSRLIGGSKSVSLVDILHVKKTLIPFGLRLFGASFHGGYYQIPGLGRIFMAITNFNDGVLIRTKHGNYIITPENPENFVEAVSDAVKSLQILVSQD